MSAAEKSLRLVWKSAGLHLARRNRDGWLEVTPDLLRAYFTRPEIHPVEESCATEHRLFERLMADPFAAVADGEIAGIADADTAANYRVVLGFRDLLARHGTVEGAYAAIFAGEKITIPPVFIEQMAHLVVANLLEQDRDPFHARAGELFFREQKATAERDQLLLADAEIVDARVREGRIGPLDGLLAAAGIPQSESVIQAMTPEKAEDYWERADRFDLAFDFRFGQRGQLALAELLEDWVRHFLRVEVRVQPLKSIEDENWTWHVGLDPEATRLLNALYEGRSLDADEARRILALYRMDFSDPTDVTERVRGRPVYLALAMNERSVVRMKPQNLLTNLPLRGKN